MIMTSTKVKEPRVFKRSGSHQSHGPIYDKRYLPRWKTSNKAFYRIDSRREIVVTQLRDLNLSGVCLHVKDDVQVDERLILKICLDKEHTFVAEAAVVWRRRDGCACYAGCSFTHLEQTKQ